MRRIGALLIGLTLVLAGCGGGAVTSPGGPTDADAGMEARMIGVYSAIIRQLVTEDHTFGSGPPPFDRVFVLDGADAEAGDPMAVPPSTVEPFSPAVQAGIIRELADLPPVKFVADRDSIVITKHECAQVKGDGVLITLGPISGGPDRVTVPSDMFEACLAGLWVTYELERADDRWLVVGTDGHGIS
jgi:hypothetical protein